MSVAFRREGDDEHKEPEFELPIPLGPNWVTPRGLRLLGEEVERLKRAASAQVDEDARKKVQRRLRYFSTRHTTAEVRTPPADGSAGIGSRVRYRLAGTEREIVIVGGDEAEPDRGHIAFTAPLARALMDAQAGETVAFQGREDAIHILTITDDAEVAA